MGRTKKELGLDSMGIQKSMRLTDYLGDGIGQLPLNIMSSLVGQLTYFYTEKVGLAAGMVATMLLIAKIFDAFSDLAMGKIMDAGRSPKGKCRPWFSRMAIPALVAIILLFTVPKNIGSGFQTAYVLITNVLITAIVYTAVAIPYGALMAIRTESFEERGKMGIFRTAFGYIAGMVIAILLIPITNMLGGTQSAWIKVAVVFGLISMLSLMILYKVSKENVQIVEKSEDDDVPFVEAIKMLFKNKYWVIMLVLQFLINISYSLTTSGGTYYAKYILGNDNIVALLGAVGLVPTFLGFILTGPLTSKFGMTKTCKISCVLGAAACLVRVFTPYSIATCMNSLNHYAYGSIGDWMYRKVAGLSQLEPGYKKFQVKPMFVKGIEEWATEFESVYGKIVAKTSCKNGKIHVHVEVPANTTAVIVLPEKEEILEVGSGVYDYEYATETCLAVERFSMDSTLGEIVAEPLAVELFNQMAPGMLEGPMIQFAYGMTLAELLGAAPQAKPLYEAVVNALNQKEAEAGSLIESYAYNK